MSISYQVAQTLDNVLDAWRLVYEAYQRQNLIGSNPLRIHTVAQAVASRSVVMLARTQDQTLHGTMSAYHDSPKGLPLDTVYQDELDVLRLQGRRLVEIGLFADRRETIQRSMQSLLELMRWTTWFAVHGGATDAVIGVHPRHADFYRRVLGFDAIGPTRAYSMVNGAPVTLLRLDWHRRVQELAGAGGSETRKLRGLQWVLANPIEPHDFTHRFDTRQQTAGAAIIHQYLRHHAQPHYNQPAMQTQAA